MAHSGGAQRAGALDCQLTLAATASRPGDTVTALLQVSCSQPEAVELQEVEIEFSGIERIDTSWVLPAYRRATPPINADKRKVQRYVVQSRLQAATQGTFSDLSLRRFVIRFTLPPWLPPTFRGTAVRYVYYLQAVIKYRVAHQLAPVAAAADLVAASDGSGDSSGSSTPDAAAAGLPAEGGSGSVASRVLLHIWPAKQSEGIDRSSSPLLSSGASAVLAASTFLAPASPGEEMPIKCWEIGPGTAVQDAVAHIVKMSSQPSQPNRPHSPGRRPGASNESGGGVGVPGGMGGALGDESGSEISLEPPLEGEREGQAAGADSTSAAAGAAAKQQQQQQAAAAGSGKLPQQGGMLHAQHPHVGESGTSTPRLHTSRRALARPSIDPAGSAILRSPSQLQPDSGSSLRSYNLRIGEQPLVRVSLHPPLEGSLQPGATLAGTLDFLPHQPVVVTTEEGETAVAPAAAAGPQPRCMQVLILLETEEIVESPWRRPVQGGGNGAIRRVYDEHLELTADTACTHFLFTIPPDAAASFQTPLLQLRWLLRFQFIASIPQTPAAPPAPAATAPAAPATANEGSGSAGTAAGGSGGTAGGSGGAAGGGDEKAAPPAADWNPLQGRLEQLTWALPVTVLSPSS